MRVEKRSWLFFVGGLLAFVGGFLIGMTGYKNNLKKEHQKRIGVKSK